MKKLLFCATLGCGMALSSFAAGPSATTFNNSEQTVVNEQNYSSCADEIIDFTGTMFMSTSGTINGNKISFKLHINYQDLQGVGETTGAIYHGNIVDNEVINEDFDGIAYDKTKVITGVITTSGGGNNRMVHINVRTKVSALGEVTTSVSNISEACQ